MFQRAPKWAGTQDTLGFGPDSFNEKGVIGGRLLYMRSGRKERRVKKASWRGLGMRQSLISE